MSADSGEVQGKRIYLSSKHYVTISVLVAIMLWVIGATTLLIDKFELAPLKRELQQAQLKLSNSTLNNTSISKELSQIKSAYQQLIFETKKPTLIYPR